MIIPEYLDRNRRNIIGCTATSDGCTDELDILRFKNGVKKIREYGYDVIFTDNVFNADEKGRSSSGHERARQINELLDNDKVGAIIAAKGGNFLNEMLDCLDFEKIKANPKWFQGYSDNTGLIHAMTTKYDIATIYGNNFGDFGMEEWHESLVNNMKLLQGDNVPQKSFDRYQDGFVDRVTGYEGYSLDNEVKWYLGGNKKIKNQDRCKLSGRMIGGCLDVLIFLQGTEYDGTLEFIEKYKDDGIIWYLETFDLSGESLMMFLWQLKRIGWFKYTKGFVFGRPLFYKDFTGTNYAEAVEYALGEFDVPIIFDCDFGHKGPRMSIINGAKAEVSYEGEGKGNIRFI